MRTQKDFKAFTKNSFKSILLLCAFMLGFQACGGDKKSFRFTGKESDAQALEKCLNLSKRKKYEQAIECLTIFKSRYPNSTYALDAELKIGDNYFNNKEWLLAAESYSLYAQLHPSSPKLDYTYYRAGKSYAKLLPKSVDRDMSSMTKALESFSRVFRSFPESPYASMAQTEYEKIQSTSAKKEMYIANYYFRAGEYRASAGRYIGVLQNYPNLGHDEKALYKLSLSYLRLGLKEKARASAEIMQEKFPQSKLTQRILRKVKGG